VTILRFNECGASCHPRVKAGDARYADLDPKGDQGFCAACAISETKGFFNAVHNHFDEGPPVARGVPRPGVPLVPWYSFAYGTAGLTVDTTKRVAVRSRARQARPGAVLTASSPDPGAPLHASRCKLCWPTSPTTTCATGNMSAHSASRCTASGKGA